MRAAEPSAPARARKKHWYKSVRPRPQPTGKAQTSCTTAPTLRASFREASLQLSPARPRGPKLRGVIFLLSWDSPPQPLASLDAAPRYKTPSRCCWVQTRSFPAFPTGMPQRAAAAPLPAACWLNSETGGRSRLKATLSQLYLAVGRVPPAKPLCYRSMTTHVSVRHSGTGDQSHGKR